MKRTTLLVLAGGLALGGCLGGDKGTYVSSSAVRGPYIDATLATSSGDWGFLFPDNETCRAILRVEAAVRYSPGGPFGRVTAPDGSQCNPVGVTSLRRWRSRRGRVEGEMAPSSAANWRIIHTDPQMLLLRGRFPVASRLGIGNTFDIVAMVPNDDTCRPVAERGEGTLRFHQTGTVVLNLSGCPVQGVATPL